MSECNCRNKLDGDHKFSISIVGIVGAFLGLVILTIGACDSYQTKLFIENGFEKQSMLGQDMPQWVKVQSSTQVNGAWVKGEK